MKFDNAINLHRKSGVAKWRDLLFILRSTESQWKRHPPLCHPECQVPRHPLQNVTGPPLQFVPTVLLIYQQPQSGLWGSGNRFSVCTSPQPVRLTGATTLL
jgi:hypothetical protein